MTSNQRNNCTEVLLTAMRTRTKMVKGCAYLNLLGS